MTCNHISSPCSPMHHLTSPPPHLTTSRHITSRLTTSPRLTLPHPLMLSAGWAAWPSAPRLSLSLPLSLSLSHTHTHDLDLDLSRSQSQSLFLCLDLDLSHDLSHDLTLFLSISLPLSLSLSLYLSLSLQHTLKSLSFFLSPLSLSLSLGTAERSPTNTAPSVGSSPSAPPPYVCLLALSLFLSIYLSLSAFCLSLSEYVVCVCKPLCVVCVWGGGHRLRLSSGGRYDMQQGRAPPTHCMMAMRPVHTARSTTAMQQGRVLPSPRTA